MAYCGTISAVQVYPTLATMTFVVRGDSLHSTVRATGAFVRRDGQPCNSYGHLEESYEQEVRARAEK
jgi:hypothetical protein